MDRNHQEERERYYELCRTVWHHNDAYFIRNDPEISDEQYDLLLAELKDWEKKHPNEVLNGSPTRCIGEKTSGRFPVHAHTWPMLSYDKIFSFDELRSFHNSCLSSVSNQLLYYVDVKIDGCAVALWYHKGVLYKGLTRGDGFYGDVITENLRNVHGIPNRLPVEFSCEIRGEVYMPLSVLEKINIERSQNGEDPFANTRNCAAGTLRSLDPLVVKKRQLSFCGYFLDSHGIQTVEQMMKTLKTWEFFTPSPSLSNSTLEGAMKFITSIEESRNKLPFKIDGIVIKINSRSDHFILGSTGQYYRWGVAFKYPAQRCYTMVKQIESHVGRSGCVTPLAILEPLVIDGSVVSRATLHNFVELEKKDVREGDWVAIEKSGDIIPHIIGPDLSRRSKDSISFSKPINCPSCKSKLAEKGAFLVCLSENCSEKLIRLLMHFVREMDIEGLGKRTVEALFLLGKITEFSDLYKLGLEDLEELDHVGIVLANKLLASIEKSKKVSFSSFLLALGIPHLGKQNAIALSKNYYSWSTLRSISIEELQGISGFGEKIANCVHKSLSLMEEQVQRLFFQGVTPFSNEINTKSCIFNGLHFVITGRFMRASREEIERMIKDNGGTVNSSVSKKIGYALVGKDPGSKLSKAQELRIPVVDESWLFSNLKKAF